MLPSWVVGIDYSMSCPAITIIHADIPVDFDSCRLFYLSTKLNKKILANITSTRLGEYESNEQRYDLISEWAVQSISQQVGKAPTAVFMEDYSFGSKGKVFHIAENSGLVKHKLWKLGYEINTIPPTVIKKFATGKGTATKDQMYDAFFNETAVPLMKHYQPKAKAVGSPVGDIVDSYYLCKYGAQQV
jgi:Holliday junction resolvasome RuvABC endonuclease subunit